MHELAPYDRIAAQWANARQQGTFRERPYVDRFLACLQAGGSVLDLGCGSGLPIARYVLDRGCRVIGSMPRPRCSVWPEPLALRPPWSEAI